MQQVAAQCSMTISTIPKTIRVSVAVTPEVHATFLKLSKAGNMSMARAMGDWLADSIEAAEFTAQKMQEARQAPSIVLREMHAYALGIVDETSGMLERVRQKGRADRAAVDAQRPRPTGWAAITPPSSNTGGKGTETPHTRRKPK